MSGTTKEPPVMVNISPVNVVVMIPATFAAVFWILAIDPTWAGVGATSPGNAQMLAAVNARLP